MKPEVLAEIRAPRSEKILLIRMELLLPNFYKEHLCRLEEWPDGVNRAFRHVNNEVYT
jgi:proline iminopeptidase